MRFHSIFAALSGLIAIASDASAQFQMVCDQTFARVQLVSDPGGVLVNADFLTDSGAPYDFQNPIEALQVYDQIWVSDSATDSIVRFDRFGLWLGTISTGIDAPRGLAVAGDRVYVVNSGTGNGAPGQAMLVYDLAGQPLFTFPLPNAWDVVDRGSELLVSNITSDNIDRYTYDGTFLGPFHDSNGISGIDQPMQMTWRASGNLIVAGMLPPNGIFEYDANGVQVAHYTIGGGFKGVSTMLDGRLLFTDTFDVRVYDFANASTVIPTVSSNFANPLRLPGPPVSYCTAGTSSNGCAPSISGIGTASATAPNGFTLRVTGVEGARTGLVFYGVSGRVEYPWSAASTSFLCVRTPTQRTPAMTSGGSIGSCNGVLQIDWNAFITANPTALGTPFYSGRIVQAQAWYRDPPAPKTTNLSDALEFDVAP